MALRKSSRETGGLNGENRKKDSWFGSKTRFSWFLTQRGWWKIGFRKLFRRFEMWNFSKPPFFYDMTQEIRKSLLKTRDFRIFEKIE